MFIFPLGIGQRQNHGPMSNNFQLLEICSTVYKNKSKNNSSLLGVLLVDTVSFTGTRKNDSKELEQYLQDIPQEDWPQRVYARAKEAVETLPEESRPSAYEIHNEVYGPLKNCKTLDEAKALFASDFDGVKPLKEIKCKCGVLYKMQTGEIKEPKGDLALYLLQHFYRQEGLLDGITKSDAGNYADKLNIPKLASRYAKMINSSSPEYGTRISEAKKAKSEDPEYRAKVSAERKARWEDPTFREKVIAGKKKKWKDPAFREKMSAIGKERFNDPEFREKVNAGNKKRWADPEAHEKQSARAKEKFNDPELRAAANTARWADPEAHEKQSVLSKDRWEDPEYRRKNVEYWGNPENRERQSAVSRGLWEDPEYREKQAVKSKEYWDDPKNRERQSLISKELWEDPEFRKKMTIVREKIWENPENREKLSGRLRKCWEDPKYREKMTAESREYWEDPESRKKQSLRAKIAWKMCPYTNSVRANLLEANPYVLSLFAREYQGEELSKHEISVIRKFQKQMWNIPGTRLEWSLGLKSADLLIKQVKENGLNSIDDPEIRDVFLKYKK